jgi:hypothetical protein
MMNAMRILDPILLHIIAVAALSSCAAPGPSRRDYDPTMPFGPASPWTARPSLEDARRIVPAAVIATNELQIVHLRCRIAPPGNLADCEVDYESRPGLGLGAAALEAARLSSLKPTLSTGEPSRGHFVSVSMNFDVGGAVNRPNYGGVYPFLFQLSDSKPEPLVVLPGP